MKYYKVFVAEPGYQKREPLTYSFGSVLLTGEIVLIPYRNKVVIGFVYEEVKSPDFKTKNIIEAIPLAPLPSEVISLHKWLMAYYPSGSGSITQLFIPSGLQKKTRERKEDKKEPAKVNLPELTKEQKTAIETIERTKDKTFLLHGETGSGKTRVYLERTKIALTKNKSVLILVPEISLVPQITKVFTDFFANKVVIYHSGLTKSVKNKNWIKILNQEEPLIVIGTRSAAFAPLNNIGLVVVDEMHEPAYKQDSAPRYNALRVAAQRSKLHNADIIYGSATPPIVEYYLAEQTGVTILKLRDQAISLAKVKPRIVDLKDKTLFSRHRYLSNKLIKAIQKRLNDREQSLIFLNRRGTARQTLCQNCGWQAVCPKCDLPLTLHADIYLLRCHTCGFSRKPYLSCPVCNSGNVVYQSIGTKALTETLKEFFPSANIMRFDTDNVTSEKLDKHYESVISGDIDILVGTQMLGKGLDIPKLSLVGIINADTSLNLPDFSSTERSHQLIHQAIGRVGRGHKLVNPSEVIAQSFQPEDPLLKAALEQDWLSMYRRELLERKQFSFPPFYFLLKITVSRKTESSAKDYIEKLHKTVLSLPLKLRVDDPTPSFYERSHGNYNWQLIIRSKQRGGLVSIIEHLPKSGFTFDLDPVNLL